MNIEIADYSALFIFPNLQEETVKQIEQIAQDTLGFNVSVGPRHLEFDYSGRDTGRKVVAFLCYVASLIGNAEGEVECVLTTDSDERVLEFYSIEGGRLYKQEAEIVRMPSVEVCLEKPETKRQTVSVV